VAHQNPRMCEKKINAEKYTKKKFRSKQTFEKNFNLILKISFFLNLIVPNLIMAEKKPQNFREFAKMYCAETPFKERYFPDMEKYYLLQKERQRGTERTNQGPSMSTADYRAVNQNLASNKLIEAAQIIVEKTRRDKT
jgi:hypothetical protein